MLNIIMHAGVLFHHSKFIHHYNNQQCIFLWDSLGVHSRPKGNDADTLSLYAGLRQYTGIHLALSINKTKLSNNSYSFFSHKINLHCKKNPSNSGYVVQLIGCLLLGQGSIHLLCEIYSPFYLQSWYQKINFVVLKNQNHKLISEIQTDLLI